MAKLSKNRKIAEEKILPGKFYSISEASTLVKEVSTSKFDGSIDLAIRLGVDPRKANQMVRGVVSLPNGTGKSIRVLALVTPDNGADYVGMDEYLAKIKSGWTDVDVIITVPAAMGKLGPLGRVLGPRGLMPNPKSGTVTMDIGKAITEVTAGKIDFKVDRFGIIHTAVGKVSFTAKQIEENANEVINSVVKLKPSSAKGAYIKSLTMSPTMGPGIAMEVKNA